MAGHGWVTPLPSGAKARCGGPSICRECAAELEEVGRGGRTLAGWVRDTLVPAWLAVNSEPMTGPMHTAMRELAERFPHLVETASPDPCRHEGAVLWNALNGVWQCHRCGERFVPVRDCPHA